MAHFVPCSPKKDAKATPQRRTRPRGRGPEEEVQEEVPRHAVRVDGSAKPPLGRRLRQLFAGIGLDEDIPEIRGQPAPGGPRPVILLDAGVLPELSHKVAASRFPPPA